MACPLSTERVWLEKSKYHDAEKDYFEHLSKLLKGTLNKNEKLENVDGVENSINTTTITNTTNTTEIMQDQQEQQQQQQSIPGTGSSKPRKSKKEKSKHGSKQLQKQKNEGEESLHQLDSSASDSVKFDVIVTTSASKQLQSSTIEQCGNAIANNSNSAEDDLKVKKKKKKKNKVSSAATATAGTIDENKVTNENQLKSSDATVDSNGCASNNNQQQQLDDEKDNNKKLEVKQRPKNLNNLKGSSSGSNQSTLVSEIAKARQHIKNSLEKMDGIAALAASPGSSPGPDVLDRLVTLERENASLRQFVGGLKKAQLESDKRLKQLESKLESLSVSGSQSSGNRSTASANKSAAPTAGRSTTKDEDDDDGVDLFGSDSEEEDAEASKIREQRLAEYAAKKSKKPTLIAKSSLVLDVKPWDDETDLKIMESEIRKIQANGLLWGASKFVPVAFGIQKLSISCVVEDDKVSIDLLTEEIEKLEDYVQSVDVAAFNKI